MSRVSGGNTSELSDVSSDWTLYPSIESRAVDAEGQIWGRNARAVAAGLRRRGVPQVGAESHVDVRRCLVPVCRKVARL